MIASDIARDVSFEAAADITSMTEIGREAAIKPTDSHQLQSTDHSES
jgi:hypothetical protein